MRYTINYLIRGKAEKQHKKLVREFASKFKEYHLIKYPIPSHATLKYPFSTKNIKKIENLLRSFCRNHKPALIKIKGFGKFDKKVIFFKLVFSKKALKIYKDLIKELKKVHRLRWVKFDKLNGKFHATVIFINFSKKFNKAWKETHKSKVKFDLKFDNITILKKPKKIWKIHKVFKIK